MSVFDVCSDLSSSDFHLPSLSHTMNWKRARQADEYMWSNEEEEAEAESSQTAAAPAKKKETGRGGKRSKSRSKTKKTAEDQPLPTLTPSDSESEWRTWMVATDLILLSNCEDIGIEYKAHTRGDRRGKRIFFLPDV